jgi:hypothetical protein
MEASEISSTNSKSSVHHFLQTNGHVNASVALFLGYTLDRSLNRPQTRSGEDKDLSRDLNSAPLAQSHLNSANYNSSHKQGNL